MADESDVLKAIAQKVSDIVYPNGTSSPSITGNNVTIHVGWPTMAVLEDLLSNNGVDITVYTVDGTEKNTTRYDPRASLGTTQVAPTLHWTVTGTTATLSGIVSVPQNVAIMVGPAGTKAKTGAYAVLANDTLGSVCDGVALALTNQGISAVVVNHSVVVTGQPIISARVGSYGTNIREVGRQQKEMQISFWAPDPTTRDLIVKLTDAQLRQVEFLNLADGTQCRFKYCQSRTSDAPSKGNIWGRMLRYTCEWGVTVSDTLYNIVEATIDTQFTPDGTLITSTVVSQS